MGVHLGPHGLVQEVLLDLGLEDGRVERDVSLTVAHANAGTGGLGRGRVRGT